MYSLPLLAHWDACPRPDKAGVARHIVTHGVHYVPGLVVPQRYVLGPLVPQRCVYVYMYILGLYRFSGRPKQQSMPQGTGDQPTVGPIF